MSFTANLDEVVSANRNRLLGSHPHWKRVRLKEVAVILNGFPFESKRFTKNQGTPLIRIRDIVPGKTETFYDGEFDPEFVVQRGEILVGMDGDFNCEPWKGEAALLNQRVCKITPDESRYAKDFLRYVLPGYLSAINAETPSVTVKHLSSRTVADIPLPLPPLSEQNRIVAEIEKQFTRLDAGVAALKRVQANLKRYRAAVLKAACEGRLVPTEAELAKASKRKANFETGEALLARILTECRQNWQGRGKYKEPAAPDATNLPLLPDGWAWASLEAVSDAVGGFAFSSAKFAEAGYQVVKMANVRMGKIDLTQRPSFISDVTPDIVEKYSLREGDLIVTLTGTRKKRDYGNVAVVKTEEGLLLNQRIARVRPHHGIDSKFLQLAMQADHYRDRFFSHETGNVGQGNVGMAAVTKEMITLAPRAEQTRIVAEVERRLSVADELDTVVSANLMRATRLRQSILQKAFTGRL